MMVFHPILMLLKRPFNFGMSNLFFFHRVHYEESCFAYCFNEPTNITQRTNFQERLRDVRCCRLP